MKLTIKRSEWLRGEGASKSFLLRPSDGKMCCLGFLGLSLGASAEEIKDKASPAETPNIKWPPSFVYHNLFSNNPVCLKLMNINDNAELTEAERETQLIEQFNKLGIEVEFVD